MSAWEFTSLGGVTRSPEKFEHVVAVPLGTSVAETRADAELPGATVMVRGVAEVRLAWLVCCPATPVPATPGKPPMVQGVDEVFWKTMGT